MARLTVKELAERQEADKAELQKSISEIASMLKQVLEQPAATPVNDDTEHVEDYSEEKLAPNEVRINKIVKNPDDSVYVTYSIGKSNHNAGGYLRWDAKYRAEGKLPWFKNRNHSGLVLNALVQHCQDEGYTSLAEDLLSVTPASDKSQF